MVPSSGAVMRAGTLGPGFEPFWAWAGVNIALPASESIANTACAVPGRNHSWRAASSCPPKRTAAWISPAGGRGGGEGVAACRWRISAAHTGAAPLVPLTSHMAAPLALPTHTPTV